VRQAITRPRRPARRILNLFKRMLPHDLTDLV